MLNSVVDTGNIRLDRLNDPDLNTAGVEVSVLRLDLIHPQLSGNKWFKLKKNLAYAKQQGYRGLLSFGGVWSNHIHALAWLGRHEGIPTIGLIRGEKPQKFTSATLQDAESWGMELQYVSRSEYRLRNDQTWLRQLAKQYPDYHIVPEGGGNTLGVEGCREISTIIESCTSGVYDLVCCACGTGSTLAGIACSLPADKEVIGIPVLKGGEGLANAVRSYIPDELLQSCARWWLYPDYHFGGYARFDAELVRFMRRFEQINDIPIEPVYTGKLIYGAYDLIRIGVIKRGSRVVVLHTGGMQGLRGTKDRTPRLI
jgi:1-aminocyclopropane-1-carboxylate deaminase